MEDSYSATAERTIKSKSWHKVAPWSAFYGLEVGRLPHAQTPLIAFSSLMGTILVVSTIYPSDRIRVNTATHWVFNFLQESISVTKLTNAYLSIIIIFLFVMVFVKVALVGYLAWLNKKGRETSESAQIMLHAIAIITWADITLLIVPLVGVCIESFFTLQIVYSCMAVVILLSLPFEIILHNTITYDFSYVRKNMVQGRTYDYLSICTGGTVLCALTYFSTRPSDLYSAKIFINCIHVVNAFVRMYFRFKWNPYFYQVLIDRILMIVESFYLTQSAVHLLCLAIPGILNYIYMDYIWLTAWPLLCILIFNLLSRRSRLEMLSFFSKSKEAILVDEELYKLEQIYFAFQNQKDHAKRLNLYTFMINHTSKCADPYCLCFHIKVNYDMTIGQIASLNAREVYAKYSKGKKSTQQMNTLSFFDDLVAIDALRFHHGSVISARIVPESKKIQVFNQVSILTDDVGSMINLDNHSEFTRVVASFLRKLLQRESKVTFAPMMANLTFLLSEYRNPLATLLLAYDYVYSRTYPAQSSILRDAILQNMILLSKRELSSHEGMNIPVNGALHNRSLSIVLDFRERTHKFRDIVQNLIMKKIDLYSMLSQKSIDFVESVTLGEELHRKTVKASRELDALLDISTKNTKLARMGVVFEMCVLERPIVSSRLRKCYKDAYFDSKNRVGSINSVSNRFKFSPFNSSNIVVFTRNYDGAFRITKFTTNSVYLFGMTMHELKGQKLSNFMPSNIGEHHDRMMFAYLNGQSQHKHDGKIFAPVLSKQGHMRSAMILVKPELQFFNEIFVAGLVSVRKKNHYPLVYTDLKGKILGTNKQAMKMIANNKKLENSSLFALFPKLFTYYYPATRMHESVMLKTSPNVKDDKHHNLDNTNEVTMVTHETGSSERDEYNKEADGSLRGRDSMDLFMFQMMYKTITSLSICENETFGKTPGNVSQSPLTVTMDNEKMYFGRHQHGKEENSRGSSSVTKLDNLSKVISDQRKLILENLPKIYKTKVDIETNHFQRHISIREITLDTIHKTRYRVQQFFKAFASNNNPYLMEVLMVSPESLNNLYKLCNYRMKLKILRDQIDENFEDDGKDMIEKPLPTAVQVTTENMEPAYSWVGVKDKLIAKKKGPVTMTEITKAKIGKHDNRVNDDEGVVMPIEIQANSWLPEGYYSEKFNQKSNSGVLENAVHPTDLDLPKYKTLNKDVYNSALKPIQSDLSVQPESNDKEQVTDSNVDNRTPKARKKDGQDRAYILEKINKFNNLVVNLKKELERDYESSKIQKLAEVILTSLKNTGSAKHAFAAVKKLFNDGGSSVGAISSRESGDAKGSDLVEGFTLKVDDSVTSDQDSIEEIHLDNSDPLKTLNENDEPSTFLKSSSKVSIKSKQDATLIRNSIRRSRSKLHFKKWEYLLYVLVFVFCSLKLVFKLVYDNNSARIYESEININLIANILRPTAFVYRESLKGWSQQFVDFNLNDAPDNKLFRPSQFTHYQERFQAQVVDLTNFFSGNLDLRYTFLEGLPQKNVSVFAMTMSLLNYYLRLTKIILTVSNQEDNSFITDNVKLWDEVRRMSRDIYQRLYKNFLEQDAERPEQLSALYLYFGLNYSMNGCIILVTTGLIVYICHVIHGQLRQASDLLLRIEKGIFKLSLKKYARISGGGTDKGEGSRDRKDFRQAVMVHMKHADYAESEQSLLGLSSGNRKSKWKKNDKNSAALRNYSTFVNFPEVNYKIIAAITLVVCFVLALPSIVNLFLILGYYETLEASLETSASINLASASYYYLQAIQYRTYIGRTVPKATPIAPELTALSYELEANINRAKKIADPYLSEVLSTTYACAKSKELVDDRQEYLCLLSSEANRDFTMIQGIQEFSLQSRLITSEVNSGTQDQMISFFSSTHFSFYDLKAFVLTIVLKNVSTLYMERILQFLGSTAALTNTLLSLFYVLTALSMVVFHWFWIPWRLKHWRQYESTLLVLNDEIINSIYIKSYFGHEYLNH